MQDIIYTGTVPAKEISQRFSETLEEIINSDPNVVYIDADLMASLKTADLWKKYPKRVFNTGIQEANMVGVAAGLYLAGFKPYIHSFAPFITRRVFDQVFISIAYAGKSVRLIGSDAGIAATDNGGTHMCFEDIALVRTIPNACIVDVSDGEMFSFFLRALKDRPGLTYFRTARRGVPDIYPEGTSFETGKGKILADGNDVSLLASGIMVATALEVSKLLRSEGINIRVVDAITVKPLDEKLVYRCATETRLVVTLENHNIIGGLGGAVAEYLSSIYPVPILRLGIQDSFGQVGSEPYLREIYQLRPKDIAMKIHQTLAMDLNASKNGRR
jgi:transketolase